MDKPRVVPIIPCEPRRDVFPYPAGLRIVDAAWGRLRMAFTILKREEESEAFDIYSGRFRLGVILALPKSMVRPKAYRWAISGVTMAAPTWGTEASVEKAAAALAHRWKSWLTDAELELASVSSRPAPRPASADILTLPVGGVTPAERRPAGESARVVPLRPASPAQAGGP